MAEAEKEPFDIVVYPDKFLNKACRKVTAEELKAGEAAGWNLEDLTERMKTTMYVAEGIGLAAPQVRVGLRIFVADISKDRSGCFAIVNPVLTSPKGTVKEEEGCLSIPGIRSKVERDEALHVSGVSIKGEPIEFDADGLLSRVCQHETDHLDGKLFINRIGSAAKFMIRRQLAELEEEFKYRKTIKPGKEF